MGLDMYLKASVYVGGWDWSDENTKRTFAAITEATGLAKVVTPESPSLTVEVTCAYWRKANAIHGWFVNNVQGGVDECQSSSVSVKQLQTLLTLCRRILDRKNCGDLKEAQEIIAEELPPTPGFFFGSTEVDEYFWFDLENTVEQLERVLAELPEGEFIYRSSW